MIHEVIQTMLSRFGNEMIVNVEIDIVVIGTPKNGVL
jgi:hypothetical protein